MARRVGPEQMAADGAGLEIQAGAAAWFAACTSVLLAVSSFAPEGSVRWAVIAIGGVAILALAPRFARRARPSTVVALTVGAGIGSVWAVLVLSGASFEAGFAASRAGDAGSPWAWLFTTASLCIAVGLAGSGYLVVAAGRRAGILHGRAGRIAWAVPLSAAVCFALMGLLPVGASRAFDVVHDQAAIVALGVFWLGMVTAAGSRRVSPALRRFSGIAALVMVVTWIPTEAKLIGLIVHSPIRTLYMQAIVFGLTSVWLVWIAREWEGLAGARPVSLTDATGEPALSAEEAS